jgi:PBP1b-binding outer membrane lipoprotein LpoB
MLRIVTILIALILVSCATAPQPKAKPQPEPVVSVPSLDPCDIDPVGCFSFDKEPDKERTNKAPIPTPLNRNDNKRKTLK